jgi:hypothetical protein
MRLRGIWSDALDIEEPAGSCSSADPASLRAIVGPQDVIAWQQATVEELHGFCWSTLTGDWWCIPA